MLAARSRLHIVQERFCSRSWNGFHLREIAFGDAFVRQKPRLVAEMATRHGIRLNDYDDPALAVMSRVEPTRVGGNGPGCFSGDQLGTRIAVRPSGGASGCQKLETRAGTVLAQQVRESAAEIRREIQHDGHAAGLRSRELLNRIHEAHRRPAVLRWTAVGILIAFFLFCCGIWVGRMTALGWGRAGF